MFQLQFFFLLHCDEWDRVVALPRHKFVTGATLLQLVSDLLINCFCFLCCNVILPSQGAKIPPSSLISLDLTSYGLFKKKQNEG
jgi:hypothetical protein